MLRIDESSKTLVAPQQGGFVPEPPMSRSELLPLLSAGWQAFASEMGQAHLQKLADEPVPGVDLLGWDEQAGRVVVVLVAGEETASQLIGRAVVGAATVAGWDAARLAGVHESLQAAVPGDSPRILIVAGELGESVVHTLDFLVRRHGIEATAYGVQMLRFGAERLMQVARTYPAAPAEHSPAGAPQQFFADVMALPQGGAHSVAPPGVPAA
jgi:hypothetical protein